MRVNIFFLITIIILTGCNPNQGKFISLHTNIPELSAYTEYFNRSQNQYKIEIVYKENPPADLLIKNGSPDIIISENLAVPGLFPLFISLEGLLKNNKIPPESIYPELLKSGSYKTKPVLLPLSFSLPMILFHSSMQDSTQEDNQSLIIPVETIKEKSLLFHPKNSKRLGFSPFQHENFTILTARLQGADFRLEEAGFLVWNKEALNRTAEYFHDWIEKIEGGYEKVNFFSDKYMNLPSYKLLESDKILYYFASSEELFHIPKEKRKNIEFRWLSHDQKIFVNDNIVYTGIPKKAKYKNGAKIFLKWLYNPTIQSRLIEINNYKRLSGIFGIAQKFSSVIEVNEKHIPPNYPSMVGHIPEPDLLIFPGSLPDDWNNIKKEKLLPWIKKRAISDKQDEFLLE